MLLMGDVEQDTVMIPKVLKRPKRRSDSSTAPGQRQAPGTWEPWPLRISGRSCRLLRAAALFLAPEVCFLVFQPREVSWALGVFRWQKCSTWFDFTLKRSKHVCALTGSG